MSNDRLAVNSKLMKFTKIDISAGVTTFFTMSYIIVVNPLILANPDTGMSFTGVTTATVLVSFLSTLLMGLYGKLPYGVAPGMGLNAFFAYSLVIGDKIPWPVALGMVFWSGVLFLIISATGLRVGIARAIPRNLRQAISCGIGLFITFIGLKNASIIQADPVTFVKIGEMNIGVGLALLGVLFSAYFLKKKSSFAFLIPIIVLTLISIPLELNVVPVSLFSAPDFNSTFFKLDILGALKLAYIPAIITIIMTDLFDSVSTFIGVSESGKLLDENGDPKNLKEGLIVDSFATLFSSLFGTSAATTYIESSAGVKMGGTSGKVAVIVAICFLPFLFLSPLIQMVPAFATAPVLILVGSLMFQNITKLELSNIEDLVPAYLTIVLIPLTFSITQGILWGFTSHVLLYLLVGRKNEISKAMYGLAALSFIMIYLN